MVCQGIITIAAQNTNVNGLYLQEYNNVALAQYIPGGIAKPCLASILIKFISTVGMQFDIAPDSGGLPSWTAPVARYPLVSMTDAVINKTKTELGISGAFWIIIYTNNYSLQIVQGTYTADSFSSGGSPISDYMAIKRGAQSWIKDSTHRMYYIIKEQDEGQPCVPNWQCVLPLNGHEQDGCGNDRLNSACNAPPPQQLPVCGGFTIT